ncbi:MAG TPA: hypothetical protein VHC47_08435 [Mucilaginibacter sp.]|nr:hypothetical protein [Mucilaginibacter sp.]
MKKIFILTAILIGIIYTSAVAQEQLDPLKQNITYTINKLGDAHVDVTRTFNASQWDNYKKIYGANAADLLKREMERTLPAAYLQNFNYKEDEMNRTFTLSFDALGFAKVNDNGDWQIDVGIKNPDITKISDNNYVMTVSYNSQGSLLQDLIKLNLPSGSSNVAQQNNAFGKPVFTYDATPARKGFGMIFLILGVLMIAASVVIYFKPELISPKTKAKPFTVVSAQQQSQPAASAEQPPPTDPNPGIEKQA